MTQDSSVKSMLAEWCGCEQIYDHSYSDDQSAYCKDAVIEQLVPRFPFLKLKGLFDNTLLNKIFFKVSRRTVYKDCFLTAISYTHENKEDN